MAFFVLELQLGYVHDVSCQPMQDPTRGAAACDRKHLVYCRFAHLGPKSVISAPVQRLLCRIGVKIAPLAD